MAPKKAQKPEPKASKKAASEKPETSKQKKTDVDPPKTQAKKRSAPESVEEAGPVYQPETSALEKKRLHAAEELRRVEQQIFDLETKYLDSSSAFGNAVRGYEGFLGGLAQANRKVVIKQEDRLFSMSSSTFVLPTQSA